MSYSYNNIQNVLPEIIQGLVIDRRSGQPIAGVNVYAGEGESVITSDSGEFVIRTWKAFPLMLVADHPAYDPVSIRITVPVKRQIIYMN